MSENDNPEQTETAGQEFPPSPFQIAPGLPDAPSVARDMTLVKVTPAPDPKATDEDDVQLMAPISWVGAFDADKDFRPTAPDAEPMPSDPIVSSAQESASSLQQTEEPIQIPAAPSPAIVSPSVPQAPTASAEKDSSKAKGSESSKPLS